MPVSMFALHANCWNYSCDDSNCKGIITIKVNICSLLNKLVAFAYIGLQLCTNVLSLELVHEMHEMSNHNTMETIGWKRILLTWNYPVIFISHSFVAVYVDLDSKVIDVKRTLMTVLDMPVRITPHATIWWTCIPASARLGTQVNWKTVLN